MSVHICLVGTKPSSALALSQAMKNDGTWQHAARPQGSCSQKHESCRGRSSSSRLCGCCTAAAAPATNKINQIWLTITDSHRLLYCSTAVKTHTDIAFPSWQLTCGSSQSQESKCTVQRLLTCNEHHAAGPTVSLPLACNASAEPLVLLRRLARPPTCGSSGG